jgi:hypothetical protein
MYRSEAELVIRRAIEETGAQFTEEQIQAISIITTKVAQTIVEEALAQMRPSGNPKSRYMGG